MSCVHPRKLVKSLARMRHTDTTHAEFDALHEELQLLTQQSVASWTEDTVEMKRYVNRVGLEV